MVCGSDPAFDIFPMLAGADPGGTWSPPLNSGTSIFDPGIDPAGTYTYTVTNGCGSTSANIGFMITAPPNTTINAVSTGPFCESDPAVTLTAVDPGGTWTGTGITNGTTGDFDPATAGPGTHEIIYTIGGFCGNADTIYIVVDPDQDASFDYPSALCCLTDPDPIANIIGTAGGTFTIDNGGTINAADGTVDIGASGAGSYVVTYTTTGPCADVQTFNVTITAGADATISAAGPFCESDAAVTLTAVDAGGTWTGTGITNGTTGTFDPATAGPGTHTITYTIGGSCGDVDTENIVVNADDDASFDYAQTTYCITDADPLANITGTVGGGFTIDNGGVINAGDGTIDLDASGAGTYTITYTTTGPCPDMSTFAVIITDTQDATITQVGPYCEGDAALDLTAVDGGGTWAGTGITDPNAGTFDPSAAGTGTHNITYTISGACGSSDNIDIVVNASDVASFSYPNATYCITELDPGPGITGTLGGTFSIDNGGVIDSNTGTIDLGASGAGTYNITYTTSGACPDAATVTVTITDGVSATITPAGPFCQPFETALTASTPGGVWSGPGIIDANAGVFNADTAGIGSHEIIYTISGVCTSADTIIIEVYEVPNITLPGSYTVDYGNSVTLVPTFTGSGTFSWNPDTDLDCSDCEMPMASPTESTTYCVNLSNGVCQDSACTLVIVEYNCGEVVVPTAFTPNSGDVNSMECVLGTCVINMQMRIYDRWGELVFESYDQNVCWDGSHMRNGKPMSTGVYVYQLDADLIDGTSVSQKGNITLIR